VEKICHVLQTTSREKNFEMKSLIIIFILYF